MEFKEISEQVFEQFSTTYKDTNFWQSTNMAHLREWNNWTNCYVAVYDNDEIKAAVMLSYRKVFLGSTFVQALRGFLLDYSDLDLVDFFHSHLMKYLKKLNCMYFKMDPYLPRIERDIDGNIVENGFNNEYIVEHFKQLGYKHCGYLRGSDNVREPNWMFVLDLKDKDEQQLLKSFDHQTRWSINKTLKMGIKITEVNNENLVGFKDIMEHTGQRRGFEDHDMRYYEGLFKTFKDEGRMLALYAQLDVDDYSNRLNNDKTSFMKELEDVEAALAELPNSKKFNKRKKVLLEDIALIDKKLNEAEQLKKEDGSVITMAAATFVLYGNEIMYLYSGAYDKYMRFNASYALQWYIIRYALEHGYDRYNFYGISGYFERDEEGFGVYEFKRGFTGTVVELVGDFYYYVQPLKYRLYETLRSIRNKVRGR